MHFLYLAFEGSGHFNDSLICFDLKKGLIFIHRIAFSDKNIDNITSLDILSQFRKFKLFCHALFPLL